MKLPSGRRVFLRAFTTDLCVFNQVFRAGQCDVDLRDVKFILDGGAHIGVTAIFWAEKYPNAVVIAVEPDSANYRLLSRNTRAYPKIQTLQAAVWEKSEKLGVRNPDDEGDRRQYGPIGQGSAVQAYTIDEIMSRFSIPHFDLLKLDVEGAEIEIFQTADKWLPLVRNMVVELHDRFRPGCRAALAQALEGYDYEEVQRGENTFILNLRKK